MARTHDRYRDCRIMRSSTRVYRRMTRWRERSSPRGSLMRAAPAGERRCDNEAVTDPFIDERNGGYYIKGTRISLDSVVYSFERGNSPEDIQKEFPLLTLPQIYRAIACYIENKDEIKQYLEAEQRRW